MLTAIQALVEALRSADEEDVGKALQNAYIGEPRTAAELLEFYNLMLDVRLLGNTDGGVLSED
jgi:hypothetical protein